MPDQMSMVKKCWWKEVEIDCPAIFDPVHTDLGMCCSFNQAEAESIFKKSTYSSTVKNLTANDKSERYTF